MIEEGKKQKSRENRGKKKKKRKEREMAKGEKNLIEEKKERNWECEKKINWRNSQERGRNKRKKWEKKIPGKTEWKVKRISEYQRQRMWGKRLKFY